MSMKERLAEIKANLEDLRPQVEAGDADAIKSVCDLSSEYEDLEGKIKAAGDYQKLMSRIGKGGKVDNDDERGFKTLGEAAAYEVKKSGMSRDNHTTITAELKAATDPHLNPSSDYAATIEEIRPEIIQGVRRPLTIAQLFAAETTDKESVTYFTEGAVEGGPAAIGEGGAYPALHVAEPTKHTDSLTKIGTYWKNSEELLEDNQRLVQHINDRADYLMDIVEEDQLYSGNGQNDNLTGLINRSGLQLVYYDPTSSIDLLLKIKSAKKLIRRFTPGFRADGICINEDDWDMLTSIRDANNQFLAGGPFYGMYGNTQVAEEPPLWGLRAVPTEATPAGLITIGAWRLGGSVVRKGGRKITIANTNEDDLLKGKVVFRPSERIALAVYYASAFLKLKSATFSACGSTEKAAANTLYYERSGSAGAYIYTLVDSSGFTAGTTDVSMYYKATAI